MFLVSLLYTPSLLDCVVSKNVYQYISKCGLLGPCESQNNILECLGFKASSLRRSLQTELSETKQQCLLGNNFILDIFFFLRGGLALFSVNGM
jgi:hypothetical protein